MREVPAADPAIASDTARSAGRGGLAIAGAKASFIALGFVQQLFLPLILGTDGWGDVGIVLAVSGIINNIVVATSIQGVSRVVSAAPPERVKTAFRKAVSTHALLAIVAAAICFAIAGPVSEFEHAPRLLAPLRTVSLIVLLYGLYAPLVGGLNGTRRFGTQAALDVTFQVLRTMGLLLGASLLLRRGGDGVLGAVTGVVIASAIILPAALSRSGTGEAGESGLTTTDYLRSLGPIFLGQVFLNVLLQTDFLMLGHFLGDAAKARGTLDVAPMYVGVQRGVQLFGLLPYQFLMSITFILFPMLAKARALGSREDVKSFTRSGVRLSILVTGLMTAPVAALAPHVLHLAYGSKPEIARYGSTALGIYALGFAAFSVLGIANAALVSLGRAVDAALFMASGVLLVAIGSRVFVPGADFGEPMLVRSAISTSMAMTVLTAATALRLRQVAGGFCPPLSIVRALAALAVAVGLGSRLPYHGKIFTILEAGGVAVAYVVILLVTREIGPEDIARLKAVAGKR